MKRRTGKRIGALVLAAVMTLGASFTSLAGSWQQNEIGWWVQNDDGSYPVNTWYQDTDGSWYFLDEQGYMISDCYRLIDGSYYAFGSDGRWSGVMFSDIYAGVWNGNNYSNEWTGFHINVPAGYQMLTGSQTGEIGNSMSMVEFVIYTPDGTGSGIELEYLDAYDYSDGANTTAEYLVSMHSIALALQGYTVEGVTTVNMGGKEYIKLSADGAGLVKRDLYCRKVGTHYFECVTAIYWLASQSALDGLLANIY